MVAPLVAAAGRTAAGAGGRQKAKEEAGSLQAIRRSEDQNKNRVQRAKEFRQGGNITRPPRAANDNFRGEVANDNEQVSQPRASKLQKAQARINSFRKLNNKTKEKAGKKENVVRFIAYLPAFFVAVLKDLLDLIGIGSLPGIGWVITALANILIFFLFLATDPPISLRASRRILSRVLVLAGTMLVEGVFFGINLAPLQTLSVILIFVLDAFGTIKKKIVKGVKKVIKR